MSIMNVGVVIPSRNYAHFLAEAMQSLVLQRTRLRVVIVNDGGSDGHILESVAQVFTSPDVSVDVVHLPYPRGIGIARNFGAAYLHTDAILFLDADDWLHFGAVDALVAGLRNADFAYGNYTENGNLIVTPAWDAETLRHQNIASYCNLWRATAFWHLGGYSDIAVAEDWELQVRAMARGVIGAKVDATIFEHRLHGANKWQRDAVKHGGLEGVALLVSNYKGG
jgi:glycosyltransferase involved in cell wall biosynthesis